MANSKTIIKPIIAFRPSQPVFLKKEFINKIIPDSQVGPYNFLCLGIKLEEKGKLCYTSRYDIFDLDYTRNIYNSTESYYSPEEFSVHLSAPLAVFNVKEVDAFLFESRRHTNREIAKILKSWIQLQTNQT